MLTKIQMCLENFRAKEWPNFLMLTMESYGLMLVRTKHFRGGRVSRLLVPFLLVSLVSGCATYRSDFLPGDDTIAAPVSAVGHYGTGIGVSRYSLNGGVGGYSYGVGESGSSCCVLLPKKIVPVIVTVKWQTYRSSVDESLDHTAIVPVHFAVPVGDSSGLYVHFLPGHLVELWVSRLPPSNPNYSGPKYIKKPGPRYLPLPGEKSEISTPVIDDK